MKINPPPDSHADMGDIKVRRKAGRPKRQDKPIDANGIKIPMPSSTLMDGVEASNKSKRTLSKALIDVLNLGPRDVEKILKDQSSPTMADLIAVAMAVKASEGSVTAFELIGDRTEGKPGVAVEAQASLVENLVKAFILQKQQPVVATALPEPTVDAEEVESEDDQEDRPIGDI